MASQQRILLLFLVLIASSSRAITSTWTQDEIISPSKLEMFVDELPNLTRIQGFNLINGTPKPKLLNIGMFKKKWKFHRDLPPTPVFAFGTSKFTASVPGPTIEALHGIDTYVTWHNHLPSKHFLPWDPTIPTAIPSTKKGIPTVVHVHGAIGNLWYHDHALGLTRVNLLAGLIGAYIIRDHEVEAPLRLPSGDEFDIPLIVFDRSFRKDGTIYMNSTGNNPSIHPQWQPEYFGDVIVVNGKAWPRLTVRRRKYRFRIINASNARFIRFFFTNESKSDTAILANDAPYPYPSGDPVNDINGKVMKFIIEKNHEIDTWHVPKTLIKYPSPDLSSASQTRYIAMYEYTSDIDGPTHLYINGKSFEQPATETPKAGTNEVWNVINLTEDNHPLHIHLGLFVVLDQTELVNLEEFKTCMTKLNNAIMCHISKYASGKKIEVPTHEKGWKNLYKIIPGYVTKILILDHEDNAMIRPLKFIK
ncbi:hypothetical protein Patl1_15282 [Pistacia atlantica]|uniref:Uncharacterized protein n=1 Tax=Pistacia atlantica TaxID=434234 RepID=A0ACC1B818_9ROSI|nr:hypothetical protein Patl1_15282 [Pistacia atlantica]